MSKDGTTSPPVTTSVPLDRDFHKEIRFKMLKEDRDNYGEVVRRLLQKWLAGEVQIDE